MCTNFTPTKKNEWVKTHFGVDLPAAEVYPQEAFPRHLAPIVVQSHNTGRIACGLASFGLIPSWAKDNKISRHTYNARSETVAEKPSYRAAWRNRQYGLVLVDNFYEPCYETGKAVRTQIRLETGEPFAIACLWDRWRQSKTGEIVTSFSMLTVNADQHPVMKRFHRDGDEKRTPVIVPEANYMDWLGASVEQAVPLMHLPMLSDLMAV
jgi:putative SOS response-associated peptidase YedK